MFKSFQCDQCNRHIHTAEDAKGKCSWASGHRPSPYGDEAHVRKQEDA